MCVCVCVEVWGGGGEVFQYCMASTQLKYVLFFSPTSEFQKKGNCSSSYVSSTEVDLEDEDPMWLPFLDLSGAWLNGQHMAPAMMVVAS